MRRRGYRYAVEWIALGQAIPNPRITDALIDFTADLFCRDRADVDRDVSTFAAARARRVDERQTHPTYGPTTASDMAHLMYSTAARGREKSLNEINQIIEANRQLGNDADQSLIRYWEAVRRLVLYKLNTTPRRAR